MAEMRTSVGTASAECAWGLWEKRVAPARITWNVMYAYSKADGRQRKCTTDAKMFQDSRAKQPPLTVEEQQSISFFLCFPDTIDPREPKGK